MEREANVKSHYGHSSCEAKFYGIDADTLEREELIGDLDDTLVECENCRGTGCIDAPHSDDDPCCPVCDGEGLVEA